MEGLASLNNGMNTIDTTRDARANGIIRKTESLAGDFSAELDRTTATESAKHKSAFLRAKDERSKKLMDACVETESLFVAQMLRQMRNTVHKGDLINGGQTEEIFEDMLYDQYALSISKTANLGIAKQMYDQLSKNL